MDSINNYFFKQQYKRKALLVYIVAIGTNKKTGSKVFPTDFLFFSRNGEYPSGTKHEVIQIRGCSPIRKPTSLQKQSNEKRLKFP